MIKIDKALLDVAILHVHEAVETTIKYYSNASEKTAIDCSVDSALYPLGKYIDIREEEEIRKLLTVEAIKAYKQYIK